MNQHYHLVFITNLPAFYKINLYNRIADKAKVLVIFTGVSTFQRNSDFYKGQRQFDHITLDNAGKIRKCFQLLGILRKTEYDRLVIGGWDSLENWMAALLSKKQKNAVVVESSIHESITRGLKGRIKRIFMRRVTTAYVSGTLQAELALRLGFKGDLIKTRGVGVFNVVEQPVFSPVEKITRFIYVGRFSPEKNLRRLIETFNQLPDLTLNMIGFGPLEDELKKKAGRNVVFHGAVANAELPKYYQQNEVFILPSLSEPWGLVIEEAMNNGLPVIISSKVGCAHEVVRNGFNGLIFDVNSEQALTDAILRMTDPPFYNSLRKNICKMDFEKIAEEQVRCYL